jgi:hypothetical protein
MSGMAELRLESENVEIIFVSGPCNVDKKHSSTEYFIESISLKSSVQKVNAKVFDLKGLDSVLMSF